MIDTIEIFVSNMLGCLKFKFLWHDSKLIKLFDKASEKIVKELNVVKVIRNLRNLKILVKNTFMNDEMKEEIKYSNKNIIDLEESS
jgi:hypothetical protein